METSAAVQRQLRAALDAALETTFDFGIRKLKASRSQPALDSGHPLNLPACRPGRTGSPGAMMSYARLMRRQACS